MKTRGFVVKPSFKVAKKTGKFVVAFQHATAAGTVVVGFNSRAAFKAWMPPFTPAGCSWVRVR